MSRSIIVLEDDGAMVTMHVTYEEGYNEKSHAHGQTKLIIQHLDRQAEEKVESTDVINPREPD